MRNHTGRCALLALAFAGSGAQALAQTTADDRLDRTERRLDELEKRYDAELRARDRKIAELEAELKRAPATTSPTDAPGATAPAQDEIERTRAEILRDIESRDATASFQRLGQDFNPQITVITDAVGSVTGKNDRANDAYNRFDVREVELDIRAAVDPRADGVFILAFERDVENPLFAEAGGEEEGGGPESSANVEEAYLFLHDFGVPNLTAKLGRFHVRFGRQNLLHLHDLPTTDPPFVNQAFLSPEALTDAGLSLSYVIPPKFTGGQYIEAIAEVVTGEGAGSESPTLGGDLTVDSPALNTHLLWNTDVSRDLNLELGASWLTAHAGDDNAQDVNLFGADVTLLRADPTGGFNNTLFQAEAIYGEFDGEGDDTNYSFGACLLGQQQLNRDVYAGLRLDWTENPSDDGQEAWGITPYVSWYWSEFLRFRFSYQHRDLEDEQEDVFYIQATWLFGSHTPHPYWSMR